MYDWLIVGAGLFGAVFAQRMTAAGKKCLVIDRRRHIGGNCYTENVEGINVHRYGAHVFHTSDAEVWDYVCRFAEFNGFINSPVANFEGKLYNLPFNMNTFHRMWGVTDPEDARRIINDQRRGIEDPKNLEEQAIALVGTDVYEKLIRGYTEKQWGRPCSELPAFIIKRIPVRFTFDNNYFDDKYQGIPIGGYTAMTEKMLEGCDVETDRHYDRTEKAKHVMYTGCIDEYFGYCLGALEYRSLRFETQLLNERDHQGVAVMNYTAAMPPYTRVIEHKHFEFLEGEKTVVTYEFPHAWTPGAEPYYPVNDDNNAALYEKYRELAAKEKNVYFGGRLGSYRYLDMDDTVRAALDAAAALSQL